MSRYVSLSRISAVELKWLQYFESFLKDLILVWHCVSGSCRCTTGICLGPVYEMTKHSNWILCLLSRCSIELQGRWWRWKWTHLQVTKLTCYEKCSLWTGFTIQTFSGREKNIIFVLKFFFFSFSRETFSTSTHSKSVTIHLFMSFVL